MVFILWMDWNVLARRHSKQRRLSLYRTYRSTYDRHWRAGPQRPERILQIERPQHSMLCGAAVQDCISPYHKTTSNLGLKLYSSCARSETTNRFGALAVRMRNCSSKPTRWTMMARIDIGED